MKFKWKFESSILKLDCKNVLTNLLAYILTIHQIIGLKKKISYWIFALQWGIIGLKKKPLEFPPIFVFFFPLKFQISNK
jgi:hypothetical protein